MLTLALATISLDVDQYMPSLGVNRTIIIKEIESNSSQLKIPGVTLPLYHQCFGNQSVGPFLTVLPVSSFLNDHSFNAE